MATSSKVAAGSLTAAALTLAAGLGMYYEGHRTQPYNDIGGVLTVCYGHTRGVESRKYSDAECEQLLRSDMRDANDAVRRCITSRMTIGQEAALTDAAYNAGPNIVCGSTLQRLANAGDWAGACAQLDRWTYAGGKVQPGLVKRRAAERALCEGAR